MQIHISCTRLMKINTMMIKWYIVIPRSFLSSLFLSPNSSVLVSNRHDMFYFLNTLCYE